MKKIETLEAFYQKKAQKGISNNLDWMPPNLHRDIGHFNVFRVMPFENGKAQPAPYQRRDFYKIMLYKGKIKMHYADKVVEIKHQALSFSSPHIPYTCEFLSEERSGYFCIFDHQFFHQFGNLNQYEVFQPDGTHIFELEDGQTDLISHIYERMLEEISSDYVHKYDVLRNLVFELLHFVTKMNPTATFEKQPQNASRRISTLFSELLERQFPIDDTHTRIYLRNASGFAQQLNVHVNHLNRAVKETTQKTTSQLIAERILQEAKILLKHSNWSITEIAFALGFTEATHFNNFFKKHTHTSPMKFRNV